MTTAWWSLGPSPGNVGDLLTPHILAALGLRVRHAPQKQAQLLAIGSIARFARPGQYVWGSGVMFATDRPTTAARYLAVRGPLTRDAVLRFGGECPEVYGDPALVLPTFHNTPVEQVHELGVVPHYIDSAATRDASALGLPVIWPLDADPLAVVDRIRACRAVVSSSLHGVIIAHAYGIPAAWLVCTDGSLHGNPRTMDGDGTKFRDYAASVGVELVPYNSIRDAVPVAAAPFDVLPLTRALDVLR